MALCRPPGHPGSMADCLTTGRTCDCAAIAPLPESTAKAALSLSLIRGAPGEG